MADDTPLRGADAVNEELEVGYDEAFETRWRHVELASHGVMLLIVLAALAGLFGRGPFSHRTHGSADGRLMVDYEPVTRYGTSTQVTLHLSAPDSVAGVSPAPDAQVPVRIFVSTVLVEPMGLQQVIPRPAATEAVGGGVAYTFEIPPGRDSALVRFVLKPSVVGPVQIDARSGDEALSFTQWVLP